MGFIGISDILLRNWMKNLLEVELAQKEVFVQQAKTARLSTEQLVRRLSWPLYTLLLLTFNVFFLSEGNDLAIYDLAVCLYMYMFKSFSSRHCHSPWHATLRHWSMAEVFAHSTWMLWHSQKMLFYTIATSCRRGGAWIISSFSFLNEWFYRKTYLFLITCTEKLQ